MARKNYRDDDLVWQVQTTIPNDYMLGQFLDDKQLPRRAMKALFDENLVLINGQKATAKAPLFIGDEVRIQLPKEKLDYTPQMWSASYGEFKVLYEDADLLVIDKPVGVTVNSVGQISVANAVAQYFKEHNIKRKIRFLNRLDRDTSGCLVVAKSGLAQAVYQQQIEDNHFEKWYITLVMGQLDPPEGIIELPMAKQADGIHYGVDKTGKMTRTGYRVLRVLQLCDFNRQAIDDGDAAQNTIAGGTASQCVSEVEVRLYTGKTHQIRVTFAHLGHSLVNDTLYGGVLLEGISPDNTFQLRASRIAFTSLRTGNRVKVNV